MKYLFIAFKIITVYLLLCIAIYLVTGIGTVFVWVMGDSVAIVFNWREMRGIVGGLCFVLMFAMPGIYMAHFSKNSRDIVAKKK